MRNGMPHSSSRTPQTAAVTPARLTAVDPTTDPNRYMALLDDLSL